MPPENFQGPRPHESLLQYLFRRSEAGRVDSGAVRETPPSKLHLVHTTILRRSQLDSAVAVPAAVHFEVYCLALQVRVPPRQPPELLLARPMHSVVALGASSFECSQAVTKCSPLRHRRRRRRPSFHLHHSRSHHRPGHRERLREYECQCCPCSSCLSPQGRQPYAGTVTPSAARARPRPPRPWPRQWTRVAWVHFWDGNRNTRPSGNARNTNAQSRSDATAGTGHT